jgi:hypothetical protein
MRLRAGGINLKIQSAELRDDGVASSSQHHGKQAETSRTKVGFNTCVRYVPSLEAAILAGRVEHLYGAPECGRGAAFSLSKPLLQ